MTSISSSSDDLKVRMKDLFSFVSWCVFKMLSKMTKLDK